MKQLAKRRTVLLTGLIVLPMFLTQVSAGQAKRGITGDWQLKMDFDGRQMSSILSLSEDDDGKLRGELINIWGLSELRDLKHEGRQLSFVQVYQSRDGEITTNFTGSIERGKLSGTFSSDRGDLQAEGSRIRRLPSIAGEWETKLKMEDREFTASMIIRADEQQKLAADWNSQWGEHEITNVAFKAGKLTFDRKSKIQDQQFDSSFEGNVKGHTLTGTIKSERGEITVEGNRVGAAVVGLWELDITSDSGSRKQLLRINPDLSAMYGPIAIKKVDLDNDQVAFKTVVDLGERRLLHIEALEK
ncbi:MAG: hypothetical protein AMJ65_16615 [Phycisphaerae bacterium SG8_4]|nr:MAG: hypothetical protein AMJ65_16615 [Phycisphaerae bacterium SG8_4]